MKAIIVKYNLTLPSGEISNVKVLALAYSSAHARELTRQMGEQHGTNVFYPLVTYIRTGYKSTIIKAIPRGSIKRYPFAKQNKLIAKLSNK